MLVGVSDGMDVRRVFLCLCGLISLGFLKAEKVLQSLNGVVGAGNFTHYRITRGGNLRISLQSVSGDADLYISGEEEHPNLETYGLKSASCGLDVIDVDSKMNRPIGVGVHGYPTKDVSKFILSISLLPLPDELEYEQFVEIFYNYDEMHSQIYGSDQKTKSSSQSSSHGSASTHSDYDEEEGSVIWHIIITILKVIFEVLL